MILKLRKTQVQIDQSLESISNVLDRRTGRANFQISDLQVANFQISALVSSCFAHLLI